MAMIILVIEWNDYDVEVRECENDTEAEAHYFSCLELNPLAIYLARTTRWFKRI